MENAGNKYEAGLDVVEIAKRVRKDIKDTVKAGDLPKGIKVSVRIDRFSMGRSIDATIKTLGGEQIHTDEFLRWVAENGYTHDMPERYTEVARVAKEAIEQIVAAYNFDNSDSQTDYFHVNFWGHVDFDYNIETAEREQLLAVA